MNKWVAGCALAAFIAFASIAYFFSDSWKTTATMLSSKNKLIYNMKNSFGFLQNNFTLNDMTTLPCFHADNILNYLILKLHCSLQKH